MASVASGISLINIRLSPSYTSDFYSTLQLNAAITNTLQSAINLFESKIKQIVVNGEVGHP